MASNARGPIASGSRVAARKRCGGRPRRC
jgi:hypothetical protein